MERENTMLESKTTDEVRLLGNHTETAVRDLAAECVRLRGVLDLIHRHGSLSPRHKQILVLADQYRREFNGNPTAAGLMLITEEMESYMKIPDGHDYR